MTTINCKERVLKTARLDSISERFLSDRENGVLMHDKGAFVDLNNALSAVLAKKNLLLCGKTGRDKERNGQCQPAPGRFHRQEISGARHALP